MWVRYVKCGFFKKRHRTPGDLLLLGFIKKNHLYGFYGVFCS